MNLDSLFSSAHLSLRTPSLVTFGAHSHHSDPGRLWAVPSGVPRCVQALSEPCPVSADSAPAHHGSLAAEPDSHSACLTLLPHDEAPLPSSPSGTTALSPDWAETWFTVGTLPVFPREPLQTGWWVPPGDLRASGPSPREAPTGPCAQEEDSFKGLHQLALHFPGRTVEASGETVLSSPGP